MRRSILTRIVPRPPLALETSALVRDGLRSYSHLRQTQGSTLIKHCEMSLKFPTRPFGCELFQPALITVPMPARLNRVAVFVPSYVLPNRPSRLNV